MFNFAKTSAPASRSWRTWNPSLAGIEPFNGWSTGDQRRALTPWERTSSEAWTDLDAVPRVSR